VARRRLLADLLADAEFLLVQIVLLHQEHGPHLIRGRAQRLANLHRKLDEIEKELRERAAVLGLDTSVTLGELRRRLARLVGHHR
jgi:hypothetical protein